jgi:carbon-monoxide dehydrogenase small subunit
VAECIPGFELGDEIEPGVYKGAFTIRVGPILSKLEGQGTLKTNPKTRTGTVEGKGVDRRGGSRATARLDYSVLAAPEGSKIGVVADITLSGPLAQVGRTGIINDIADRLTEQFVAEVERRLTAGAAPSAARSGPADMPAGAAGPAAPAEPAKKEFDVGNAVVSGLLGRVRRFFARLFGRSRR